MIGVKATHSILLAFALKKKAGDQDICNIPLTDILISKLKDKQKLRRLYLLYVFFIYFFFTELRMLVKNSNKNPHRPRLNKFVLSTSFKNSETKS